MFEFKPAEKRKERKSPKPRINQEASSEFETEFESSDCQCPGDESNCIVDFLEKISNKSKLLVKNESLRYKIEHLELENKELKEKKH